MKKAINKTRSFTDLYQGMLSDRPLIGSLLPGHLAIEFLLRKLAQQYDLRLTKQVDRLRHAQLITFSFEIGTIDAEQHAVLTTINNMRNKLAHDIDYEPTLSQLLDLWRKAARAFDDLTDGIGQGIEDLEAASNIEMLQGYTIPELFVQICYDLQNEYIDRGGDHDLL